MASFELIRARGRSKSEPALCPGESAEDKNHKEMKARKSPDKLSVRLDGPEAPHRPVLEDRAADDILLRQEAPDVGVERVVAVVSQQS